MSVAGIGKLKPHKKRRQIADAGCTGLHLVIQLSGSKSWALRYRQNGRPVKLTLGKYTEIKIFDKPVVGSALTLADAHALGAEINRQRTATEGYDPISEKKARKLRDRPTITDAADNAFPALAAFYIRHGRRKKIAKGIDRNKGWRNTAQVLGLRYDQDDAEPTLIKGGLAEKWSAKSAAAVTAGLVGSWHLMSYRRPDVR